MNLTHETKRFPIARATGLALILMAIAAGFAFGYAMPQVYFEEDPQRTYSAVQNHGSLVHAIAWSFVWVLLLDVLVSFGFYAWLKSKAPALSKWMAGTRLLYSLILAVGIYDLFDAVPFPSESDIQSYEALKHFHQVFSFGLILFGVHLFLLGLLLLKNQNIPKILGILALFAGVCYSMVHLMPHLGETLASLKPTAESILALPMAAGELILAFWMIFKGKRSL